MIYDHHHHHHHQNTLRAREKHEDKRVEYPPNTLVDANTLDVVDEPDRLFWQTACVNQVEKCVYICF